MSTNLKDTQKLLFDTIDKSFVGTVIGNSIALAVCISTIMILLIMIFYPAKSGTPFLIVAKMFLYMTIIVSIVLFVHDRIVVNRVVEHNDDIKLLNNITGGLDIMGGDDYVQAENNLQTAPIGLPPAPIDTQPIQPIQPVQPVQPKHVTHSKKRTSSNSMMNARTINVSGGNRYGFQ